MTAHIPDSIPYTGGRTDKTGRGLRLFSAAFPN